MRTPTLLPLPLALTLLAACTPTTTTTGTPDPNDTATATGNGSSTATQTDSGTSTATDTATGTDVITVNRAPSAPVVTLTPAAPRTGDDLLAHAEATDPDGDTLSYTFAWSLDDVVQTDLTGTTVPGARVVGHGTWSVSVVASDGQAQSAPGTAQVTITNTAPTLDAVTLSPADPGVEDAIVATAEGADDADGDDVTITYTWFVDGFEVQTGGSDTLAPGFAFKGQDVHVVATPDDGTDEGAAVESDPVLVRNTAPRGSSVSVDPAAPTTATGATCVPGSASDPDPGDTVGWTYAWLRNGMELAGQAAATLPGSAFGRGHRLTCRATPSDGTDTGSPLRSAQRTVGNAAPTLAGVTLSSLSPVEGDTLSVTLSGLSDTDAGDTAEAAYAWFVNDAQVSVSSTLPSSMFQKGDRVHVVVTPVDGLGSGTPVTSATAVVGNSAPSVTSVTLTPADPGVEDAIVATAEGADDADGDDVTITYTWFVDGFQVQTGDSDTLAPGFAFKGQDVHVVATPDDGTDEGAAVESDPVLVRNTAPSGSGVSVDPAAPTTATGATCVPGSASDPDPGDSVGWTYGWLRNGTELAGQTGATLPGSAFGRGDRLTCRATPSDGTDAGSPLQSAQRAVGNAAPTLAGVTLSSLSPVEGDTLSVTLSGLSDTDTGDTAEAAYAWFVNDAQVSVSSTLPSSMFQKGDRVHVVVTPVDGLGSGTPVTSATAVVGNSAPSVTSVTLSPESVYTNTVLTANVTTSDPDAAAGDTVHVTYAWRVNGSPVAGVTGNSLSGVTAFNKGDTVSVRVTARDANEAASAHVSSADVMVLDSPPTAPVVEITPAEPLEGDDLTCSVVTPSTDADGDEVTYEFGWARNGFPYDNAASEATTSTVYGPSTSYLDEWSCSVSSHAGGAISAASPSIKAVGAELVWGHPLTSVPQQTVTANGGCGSQGPGNLYGEPCWRLMSDWNAASVPLQWADYRYLRISIDVFVLEGPINNTNDDSRAGVRGSGLGLELRNGRGLFAVIAGNRVVSAGQAPLNRWTQIELEADFSTGALSVRRDGAVVASSFMTPEEAAQAAPSSFVEWGGGGACNSEPGTAVRNLYIHGVRW